MPPITTKSKLSETMYIIETINLLKKEFPNNAEYQTSFNKMMDTICHTAPEIIDQRWMKIYNFCSTRLTDMTNQAHINAFKIYQKRMKEYRELYYN